MTIERQLGELRVTAPPGTEQAVLLGTGLIDGYRTFESPVGPVVVAFNPRGVSSVDLADEEAEGRFEARFGRRMVPAATPRGWEMKIGRAIERGTPGDLPLDLRAVTEFQRNVLTLTAAIPRGQVRSYGWLAKEIGNPGAVRAVGSTMARNPVPLVVPCHRVVRTDGRIGAYSLGGADRKWTLLFAEGVDPANLETLAGRGVRYIGSDTTGVFCHPTCAHARRITPGHRVEFRSISDATDARYRPCLSCRP